MSKAKQTLTDAEVNELLHEGMGWYVDMIGNDAKDWFGDPCYLGMKNWHDKELPSKKHLAQLIRKYLESQPFQQMSEKCADGLIEVFQENKQLYQEIELAEDSRDEAKQAIFSALTKEQKKQLKQYLKQLDIQ